MTILAFILKYYGEFTVDALTGYLSNQLGTAEVDFILENMHMQNGGADIPLAPYLEE